MAFFLINIAIIMIFYLLRIFYSSLIHNPYQYKRIKINDNRSRINGKP